MVRKAIHDQLLRRLGEKRRFLQVLAGPRQVGKTTLVRQVMEECKLSAPNGFGVEVGAQGAEGRNGPRRMAQVQTEARAMRGLWR